MSTPPSPLSPSSAEDAFTIRPLAAADIPAVRDLHTALLHLSRPLPLTFFHQTLYHPSRVCLVAVRASDAAPLAFVTAALQRPTTDIAPAPAPQLQILTLGVQPAYRRRGLATRLVYAAAAALQPEAGQKAPTHEKDGVRVAAQYSVKDGLAGAFWEGVGVDATDKGAKGRVLGRAGSVRVEGQLASTSFLTR